MADCDAILHHAPPPNAGFFVISLPFAAVLESQLKISADRIHLVRPGLLASREVTCFSHADRVATILCTSPLEREYGVDLLVEAVAILRKKGRRLMVFLLGRGRHESVLRKLVREHRLYDAVTFASPMGDIGQAMQSADIFVRPSVDTAFSVDVLQAMGAGMAVVTYPNTLLDYLRDGETAVFGRNHNAQSLADALERLMADRTEARRIATNGRDHVKAHHAMSTMAEETAAVYRDLALARATFSIRRP
jgi:glycosyltransferase involved in cell wall biosynthesis